MKHSTYALAEHVKEIQGLIKKDATYILQKGEEKMGKEKDFEPGRITETKGIKTIPMVRDLLRLTEKLLDQNRMILQANVELLKLLAGSHYYVSLKRNENWKGMKK